MEVTALVPIDSAVGIDYSTLNQLESYEDYLSFYMQLEEASTVYAWLKADTLYQMAQQLGGQSLQALAKQLRQKKSTVINYVRVAKAFPSDKREPLASFSAHFQASYADSFSEKNQEFTGVKRFEWIKRAADENLSAKEVARGVQQEKQDAILLTDGIRAALEHEATNKVTIIIKLLEDLLKATKRGDEDAYSKIVGIYTNIYG